MITYRGMYANTVEEALNLFGEEETVYIAANYDPFIEDFVNTEKKMFESA